MPKLLNFKDPLDDIIDALEPSAIPEEFISGFCVYQEGRKPRVLSVPMFDALFGEPHSDHFDSMVEILNIEAIEAMIDWDKAKATIRYYSDMILEPISKKTPSLKR